MSSIKNVILIGAGGNLGSPILDALNSAQFNVTVLSRKSSKSTFPSSQHVITIADDYPYHDLVAAFKGQDAVVFAATLLNAGAQKSIIDAAAEAGVKRFVPGEFGSNTYNEEALELVPLIRGRKQNLDYLNEKSKTSGLTWTGIVTSAFFDWGLKVGFLMFDLANHKATVVDGGDSVWSATNLAQIGRAVAGALQKPEETKNKLLYISSFEVSQNQVIAALEKESGKKWEVDHVKSEDLIKGGQEKLAKNDPTGLYDLLKATVFVPKYGANFSDNPEYANGLLELPKENLEGTIKNILNSKA